MARVERFQTTDALMAGAADGTIQVAAKDSQLAEYPREISADRDHVEALSSALAAYG